MIFAYHKLGWDFFSKEEIEYFLNLYKITTTSPFFNIVDTPDNLFIKGKKVVASVLCYSKKYTWYAIHIDGKLDYRNKNSGVLAIQIPISGTVGSKTVFYESLDPDPIRVYLTSDHGVNGSTRKKLKDKNLPHYIVPKKSKVKKLAELELTEPTIINIGQAAHEVINLKDEPRLALSLRLVEDPWDWIPDSHKYSR